MGFVLWYKNLPSEKNMIRQASVSVLKKSPTKFIWHVWDTFIWGIVIFHPSSSPPFGHFNLVCVEVLRPSQPNRVMSSAVSLPNHTFTGQAYSSKRLTSIVLILSPETDNCPSWISGRERMTVENISWSISTKECCRPRRRLNPRPPGLQSDGASNWATEAGFKSC